MDFFAHGFFSYIIFHKHKPWYAVAFGMLPDAMSWFLYSIYMFFTSTGFGRPDVSIVPAWTWQLYNISHSLLVASTAIIILYLLIQEFPVYALAWPVAITMDFLTHTREFLPTPFLWPLTDWKFPGIAWSSPWFVAVYWSVIIFSLFYIKRKK